MICWGQRSRGYWHPACDRVIDSSSHECKCENPARGRLSCRRVSQTLEDPQVHRPDVIPEEQHGRRLLRLDSEMPAEKSQKGYYIRAQVSSVSGAALGNTRVLWCRD